MYPNRSALMSQATNRTAPDSNSDMVRAAGAAQPFAGLIDPILVDDPVAFPFAGSVARSHAAAAWTWVLRDLCPDLISAEGVAKGHVGAAELELIMPELLARMKDGLANAEVNSDAGRRLRASLGTVDAREALPIIIGALRNRALLGKAQAFGRAVNTITDDGALGVALHSMPLQDKALAALLFHAAIGQVANPTKLVTTVIKLAGNATESAIHRVGFAPIIEAVLSHALNQLQVLQPFGPFADIDLTCRALERYHRLMRALTAYVEFARGSRWTMIVSAATKQVSDRIGPRLRDVVPDITHALRKPQHGHDRLDADLLLAALNGVYLLRTIRDCRESLALNALFDQAWSQSGEALELLLQRNMDLLRQGQGDAIVAARLDAGIKMAEVRFNAEYAETLRRSRATAERRL